jgi:hypothetical protein
MNNRVGNGRQGEIIDGGHLQTETVIVATRNDGMSNQISDRCQWSRFISKNHELQMISTEQGMPIEVIPQPA